VNLKLKMGR